MPFMSKANWCCPGPLSLPEKSHVRVTIESDLEREAWLKLSEENLSKTWNNPDDDVFNELLDRSGRRPPSDTHSRI